MTKINVVLWRDDIKRIAKKMLKTRAVADAQW